MISVGRVANDAPPFTLCWVCTRLAIFPERFRCCSCNNYLVVHSGYPWSRYSFGGMREGAAVSGCRIFARFYIRSALELTN
jgi:hypothetical protein